MCHQQEKFNKIMKIAGISPKEIKQSFDIEKNRKQAFKAGEGAGKSGSFFFFTKDNKFIVKTLQGSEKEALLSMLDDFIQYLENFANYSLIAKVFGVYTIKTNRYKAVDMIIMENTAQSINPSHHQMKFDMKGSTFQREAKFREDNFWLKKLH